jgi:5-methylcytosine-specific restriction enzyme subunit McrC
MTYHRLNEHYRNPHALAWLILDGLGTRDVLVTGETNCFAFLIDMNRLFQMFVFRLVDSCSRDRPCAFTISARTAPSF